MALDGQSQDEKVIVMVKRAGVQGDNAIYVGMDEDTGLVDEELVFDKDSLWKANISRKTTVKMKSQWAIY